MKFNHYQAIMYGGSILLLLLEICLIVLLSNRLLAELIERIFEIPRLDQQTSIMNFFGVQIDLKSSRRFRLSFIVQLAIIAWINLLLLLDGCVLQVQHLSGQDLCPSETSDCFTMGEFSSHERIACEPGGIISNSTATHALCFIWVYSEQNTLNVLNQIGICSSVFELICHIFKFCCRVSRRRWGLILLTLLAISSLTLFIVSVVIEMRISMTTKLLLMGVSCLMINVIQLFQFTHHYKSKC
jgi:hypothetical protein